MAVIDRHVFFCRFDGIYVNCPPNLHRIYGSFVNDPYEKLGIKLVGCGVPDAPLQFAHGMSGTPSPTIAEIYFQKILTQQVKCVNMQV